MSHVARHGKIAILKGAAKGRPRRSFKCWWLEIGPSHGVNIESKRTLLGDLLWVRQVQNTGNFMLFNQGLSGTKRALLKAASTLAVGAALAGGLAITQTASAIIARDDVGSAAIRDTANAWPWVGQFLTWNNRASYSFGLCTTQVISPRVVLLAAHCVGGYAGTEAYGVGGKDAAVIFQTRTLAALRQWAGIDPSTTAIGASNEANQVYKVIDIIAHPYNTRNAFVAGNADVMLAVLDQPVNGFNGYGMLFSPLTALETVDLVGFGNQGTMASGQINVDWWRRAGQNMLGMLGSANDIFGSDLFGNDPPTPGYGGDTYWVDSDSHLNPRPAGDYNIFGGTALPNEVGIAQGDSGGAMWVRRNGVPIAIGVESFGYSFGVSFGRGAITTATALFPYWDFIVANNAYVYTSAKTGGGAWENGATWVQMLDPNYFITGAGGALVNALPTTDPVGDTGAAPNVGGVRPLPLFPVPASGGGQLSTASSVASSYGGPARLGTLGGQISDFSFHVTLDTATGGTTPSGDGFGANASVVSDSLTAARLAASSNLGAVRDNPVALAGGIGSGYWPVGAAPMSGPGSTNFVPNNTNGVIGTAFTNAARFFEVQLVNSGTVTLSSARTIDRLRIMSAQAGLTINTGASLTTIMSSTVESGTLLVNGTLRARGVGVFGGTLAGSGLIQASGGVNVSGAVKAAGTSAITSGVVAPGGLGTVGTLTFEGNVSFAGGVFAVDMSGASTFDRIVVNNLAGVTSGTNGTFSSPGAGVLPVISISLLNGFMPTHGSTYNVVTAAGGVTGSFTVANTLPGVLRAAYAAAGNNGVITITALPYSGTGAFTSPEQIEAARGLDAVRAAGGYAALKSLFDSLDPLALSAYPATFEALVPLNTFMARGLTEGGSVIMRGKVMDRADQLVSGGGHGFSVAGIGQLGLGPKLASADPYDAMMMGAAALAAADEAAANAATGVRSIQLKEGWGGFLNISSIVRGKYEVTPFARDAKLDGFNITAGLDYTFAGDQAFVGAALSYGDNSAKLNAPLQSADSRSLGMTFYAGARIGGGLRITGYGGYSSYEYDLSRTVPLIPTSQTLTASPGGHAWVLGAKLGYDVDVGQGALTPYIGIDGRWTMIAGYTETGGSAAMSVVKQDGQAIDLRVGLSYKGMFQLNETSVLRPKVTIAYASALRDDNNAVSAAFSGFPAVPMTFLGSTRSKNWVEYEAGVEYESDDFGLSLTYSGADDGRLHYGVVAGRVSLSW